jgi:hypothetical protein
MNGDCPGFDMECDARARAVPFRVHSTEHLLQILSQLERVGSRQETLAETTVFEGIRARLFSGISVRMKIRFKGVIVAGCKCHRSQ